MKKMILFCCLLSGTFSLDAQKEMTSGVVTYEEKVKLEIRMEGDDAQFASALPRESSSKNILLFTSGLSLYKPYDRNQQEETVTTEVEGAAVMTKLIRPENKFFVDLEQKKVVEQRDFMSRLFLIEKPLEQGKWKITENQKTILGYSCREAVMEEDSIRIVAWFAPAIPVPSGPGRFNNLPGLVLAVDIDNGRRTVTATSVDLRQVEKDLIERPREGKKVTDEEFDKIVEEKTREMEQQYGTRGGVVIKIRR